MGQEDFPEKLGIDLGLTRYMRVRPELGYGKGEQYHLPASKVSESSFIHSFVRSFVHSFVQQILIEHCKQITY